MIKKINMSDYENIRGGLIIEVETPNGPLYCIMKEKTGTLLRTLDPATGTFNLFGFNTLKAAASMDRNKNPENPDAGKYYAKFSEMLPDGMITLYPIED